MRRRHAPGPLRPLALALLLPALWAAQAPRAQELTPEPPPLPAPVSRADAPAAAPHLPPPPDATAESLPALLARVLAGDPQVRVARSLLAAADARRQQARSRLGPSLQLSVLNGRSRDRETLGELDRQTDRAEAGLRWNLYNGGNDRAELQASGRDRDAAAQDLRRAREEGSERLTEPYLELLRLQTLLPAAADRLAAVRRLAAQVQRQHEAGKASDADTAQATASQLDAEIVVEQLQADFLAARERLAALAGTELRAVLPVVLPAWAVGAAAAAPAGAPGLVEAARLRAEAARARVRPPASVFAPRIDLEVRHQLSDRTTPAQTTEQQRSWLLSARWDFPVMGELQARREESRRRAEAADAEAERIARGARAELLALGPRIAGAERAIAQLDRQIAQYDALLRAGELQFEAGRRSLAQLMQLRDSRFNAEQRRAEQAQRLLAAQLRRLALTGQLLPALGLDGGADDSGD